MILGITGAFGAGKTAVREIFVQLGWHIFDADSVCHSLYAQTGGVFFESLVRTWGKEILSPAGAIDRKKLAEKVMADKEELEKLTALLYPELDRKLTAEIQFCRNNNINGAFEIPLLFEKGYEKYFDATLAVWSAPEIRRKRLEEKRSFPREEILRREALQLDPDQKLERADFAVINNGSKELLKEQIEKIVHLNIQEK